MSRFPLSSITAALLALPAWAGEDSPEWQALVSPLRQFEIGLASVQGATPVFAHHTKFDTDKQHLIGAFDLNGGATFGSLDRTRWRLSGTSLGLDSRSLQGEYGQQGRYRLQFGYDQIPRHQPTDGYQTPIVDAGGTALSLGPKHPFDLSSQRRRSELGGSLWLSPELEFRAAFHEDRQTGTRATGAALSGTGGTSVAAILPEPIDTTTRRFETQLAFQRAGHHLRLAYDASLFSNAVSGWTFPNPVNLADTQIKRMGSEPDNQMHRLTLAGGLKLGPTTRLTGSAAYGRLSQNEAFLPYSTGASPALPRDSLDGLVILRQINLHFASRPWRPLRLNATYRFSERDNRTPVATYRLPATEIGSAPAAPLLNTPFSRRTRLGRIEAGWAVRSGSDLNLSAQREETARYCHGHADCTEVANARENTLKLEWRQDLLPGISGSIGLSEADRRGERYQPFHESIELAGMRKFFLADRQRSQWRTRLNAALSDALQLGLGWDVNRDHYSRSPYGLQAADSSAFNLDLSHAFNEDASASLFATRETLRSRLASSYAPTATGNVANAVTGNQWQAHMDDTVDTLGLNFRHHGLLSGQITLDGSLVWVRAHSPYQVSGGPNLPATQQAKALPAFNSRSVELQLNGRYLLDEQSSLRLSYLYRRLASADFSLDLYAGATLARLLGTEETAPRYAVHLLGLSYLYNFR